MAYKSHWIIVSRKTGKIFGYPFLVFQEAVETLKHYHDQEMLKDYFIEYHPAHNGVLQRV